MAPSRSPFWPRCLFIPLINPRAVSSPRVPPHCVCCQCRRFLHRPRARALHRDGDDDGPVRRLPAGRHPRRDTTLLGTRRALCLVTYPAFIEPLSSPHDALIQSLLLTHTTPRTDLSSMPPALRLCRRCVPAWPTSWRGGAWSGPRSSPCTTAAPTPTNGWSWTWTASSAPPGAPSPSTPLSLSPRSLTYANQWMVMDLDRLVGAARCAEPF